MNETTLSAKSSSSRREPIQQIKKPDKQIFILNRQVGKFELDKDSSDTAIEFKLADYAIRHVLNDFETQS